MLLCIYSFIFIYFSKVQFEEFSGIKLNAYQEKELWPAVALNEALK